MTKIIAFTFARAGSKGVPGKNIKLLNGKPLLAYAIEAAHGCELIEEHFVSTDGKKIAQVANQLGVKVIVRPHKLASDAASEWNAWQHAVKQLIDENMMSENDIFVSVPCTSPLRTSDDITKVIEKFIRNDCDLALGITEADHSPYFNMVKCDSNDTVSILCDGESYVRRQDAPEAWNITTMAYVSTARFILGSNGVMDGRVLGVKMDKARSLDIDTELDFLFAEFLLLKLPSNLKK